MSWKRKDRPIDRRLYDVQVQTQGRYGNWNIRASALSRSRAERVAADLFMEYEKAAGVRIVPVEV